MIERILLTVIAFLVLFVGGALLLPREVRVERSIEIARPVGTVFTLLNRFETFPAWSPWSVRDPNVSYTISGPEAGPDARVEWSGDPRLVGAGWMEISDSQPNSMIRYTLEMDEKRQASGVFQIQRMAGGARVTWTFDTDLVKGQGLYAGLMSRYFGLLFDRWIGPDFERGLDGLKRYAEALPTADFSGLKVNRIDAIPLDVLYVAMSGGAGVSDKLALAYHDISAFMAAHDLERSGPPIFLKRDGGRGRYRYEAAIPVSRVETPDEEHVRWGRTPRGLALRVIHRGAYEQLDVTYQKLAAWMAAHGFRQGDASWEQYISDPATTDPENRITHIYVPVVPKG
ncbi:MAG: hypothetical protein HKO85_11370 [Xanthomonadales bacterium]|nr:hypothetical protein [Xanthomonadales bacterium]